MPLTTPQDIQTASHEAGHAVMALHFDIIPDWVTISPNDNETLHGYTRIKEHPIDPMAAIKHVLVDCAGYAALWVTGHTEEEARDGAEFDFEHASERLSDWALPGTVEEWKTVAVSLMSTLANFEAVVLIAEALLEHEGLSGDHCASLIEQAAGSPYNNP